MTPRSQDQRRLSVIVTAALLVGMLFGVLGTLGFQGLTASDAKTASAPRETVSAPAAGVSATSWVNWTDMTNGHRNVANPTIKKDPVVKGDSKDVVLAKDNLNRNVVNNPFYDCRDGRNKGANWQTLADRGLKPCVNGFIHVRMSATGDLTVLAKSTPDLHVDTAKVNDSTKANTYEYNPSGWDLRAHQSSVKQYVSETVSVDVTYYSLGYKSNERYYPFANFAKTEGGTWQKIANLDDHTWKTGTTTEFVLTWQDPTRPMTDARVPFDWSTVSLVS